MKPLLKSLPKLEVISLHYTIYTHSKRKFDLMNIGCIVDKYFSDTLVACGILEDDNMDFIPEVTFSFGGHTEEKESYCIVEIKPKKENNMQITYSNDLVLTLLQSAIAQRYLPQGSQEPINVSLDPQGNMVAVIGNEVEQTTTTEVVDEAPEETVQDTVEETPAPKRRRKRRTKAQIEADQQKEQEEEQQDDDEGSTSDNSGNSLFDDDSSDEEDEAESLSMNESSDDFFS